MDLFWKYQFFCNATALCINHIEVVVSKSAWAINLRFEVIITIKNLKQVIESSFNMRFVFNGLKLFNFKIPMEIGCFVF